MLYPDDSLLKGKELRLRQEYFFVSATVQDILARFLRLGLPWKELPSKMAIQLNDTHPALAIPEMMRLLTTEYFLSYDEAWDLTIHCFSYTNHTVMNEALETWSLEIMGRLLPWYMLIVSVISSITQIIYDINWNFMQLVQKQFQNDSELLQIMENTSIFSNDVDKRVRMANLCFIGSHTVNGVSELHTSILRNNLFHYFVRIQPDQIINVTNGITPRRWLLQCNPCSAY